MSKFKIGSLIRSKRFIVAPFLVAMVIMFVMIFFVSLAGLKVA